MLIIPSYRRTESLRPGAMWLGEKSYATIMMCLPRCACSPWQLWHGIGGNKPLLVVFRDCSSRMNSCPSINLAKSWGGHRPSGKTYYCCFMKWMWNQTAFLVLCLYPVLHPASSREVFCSQWWLRQRPKTDQNVENKWLWNAGLKWDICSTPKG